jgi:hypothetical protein
MPDLPVGIGPAIVVHFAGALCGAFPDKFYARRPPLSLIAQAATAADRPYSLRVREPSPDRLQFCPEYEALRIQNAPSRDPSGDETNGRVVWNRDQGRLCWDLCSDCSAGKRVRDCWERFVPRASQRRCGQLERAAAMQIAECGSIHTVLRLPLERFERVPDSLAGEIRLRLEKAPGLGLHHAQKDPDVQITVEFLRLAVCQRARPGFGGQFLHALFIAGGQLHRKQVASHFRSELAFLRLDDSREDRGFCIGRDDLRTQFPTLPFLSSVISGSIQNPYGRTAARKCCALHPRPHPRLRRSGRSGFRRPPSGGCQRPAYCGAAQALKDARGSPVTPFADLIEPQKLASLPS